MNRLPLSLRVPRYWPLILAIPKGPYPSSLSALDISRCPCRHPLSTPRCSVLRCWTPQMSMTQPSLCSQVFCSVFLYILQMLMSQVLPRPLGPLAMLSLDPVLRCQAPGVRPPFRPSLAKVGERRLPGPQCDVSQAGRLLPWPWPHRGPASRGVPSPPGAVTLLVGTERRRLKMARMSCLLGSPMVTENRGEAIPDNREETRRSGCRLPETEGRGCA